MVIDYGFVDDVGGFWLVVLSFLLVLLLAFVLVTHYRWSRHRKYAEVLNLLNDGYGAIYDFVDRNDDQRTDFRDAEIACRVFCNRIAAAYSGITGSQCSATVKVLTYDDDEDQLLALTLTRDTVARNFRNHTDDHVKHYINENTGYRWLYNRVGMARPNFFLRNNLPLLTLLRRFESTSFEAYDNPDLSPWAVFRRWPLPYSSMLLVPITTTETPTKSSTLGFLCIDSPSLGVFRQKYDVPLAIGAASALYNFLDRVHKHYYER